MVANIVAYLLKAAQYGEISDRIDENDFTRQSQPGSDANHILLGYTDVNEATRELLGIRLNQTVADIPNKKEDILILLRQVNQTGYKRRSQLGAPKFSQRPA
tara:strand:- start:211 stop:516 length:306 start_codon:yes stop_codon:yes gene_type:complete